VSRHVKVQGANNMDEVTPSPTPSAADVKTEGEKAVPYERFKEVNDQLKALKEAQEQRARELEIEKRSRMSAEERLALDASEKAEKVKELEQQNYLLAKKMATQEVLQKYPHAAKVVNDFGMELQGDSIEALEEHARTIEAKATATGGELEEGKSFPIYDRGKGREPLPVEKTDAWKIPLEDLRKILPKKS